VVPRARWNDAMLPVADWLRLPESTAAEHIPYLWAVDAGDRLHRLTVDARLMQATRRCLLLWHRLQEHAGIHDSHAERLLVRERAAWEEDKRRSLEALGKQLAEATPAAATVPEDESGSGSIPRVDVEAAHPREEAWIETSRCPSCNECQKINDRMFTYNENKQAYIKDINAGTYRQLVEAAEVCQVAIIHPGLPRNPDEPGLEELLKRAEPFM
jgi:ferredoxin